MYGKVWECLLGLQLLLWRCDACNNKILCMCNGFYVCFFFSQTSTQNKLMGSLAGGLAGACQIIITTPMELLKIQQQDQGRTGTIP